MFFKRKESEAFKWLKDNIGKASVFKDGSGFITVQILGVPIGGKLNELPNSYMYLVDGLVGNLSSREAQIARKMLGKEIVKKLKNDRDQAIKRRSEQFINHIRSNQ